MLNFWCYKPLLTFTAFYAYIRRTTRAGDSVVMKKKVFILLFAVFSVAIFSFLSAPQVNAQACAAPAAASGVVVEFPGCTGDSCDLTQASCSWSSQADAASFNVTITEVESGTILKNNESQSASTLKILFPITQGKTYKCDVVAVSACGGLAAATSDQLLCQVDALITPSVAPTATPIPPTPTPTPTIAPPGGMFQTLALSAGILIAVVGGIILLVL